MNVNQLYRQDRFGEPQGLANNRNPDAPLASQRPIEVGDSDYEWNMPSSAESDADTNGVSAKAAVTSSSYFTLENLSLHECPTTARTTTTASSSRVSSSPSTDRPLSSKRHKQEAQLGSASYQSSDPQRSSSSSKRLHNRSHTEKRRERRIEKDAAKTAATYYGECYLVGVGMNQADKAARDSHNRYKKWWLQEIQHADNLVASVGDGIKVPIYNSPPGPTSSVRIYNRGLENRKVGPTSECYAVDNTEYTTPIISKEIGGSASVTAAATLQPYGNSPDYHPSVLLESAGGFDRSSGVRHPSPTDHKSRQAEHETATDFTRTKKRQRSASNAEAMKCHAATTKMSSESVCSSTDETIAISNCHALLHPAHEQTHEINILRFDPTRSKSAPIVSENNSIDSHPMTDDETAKASNSSRRLLLQSAFDRERSRRVARQRRGSSSSDYDDGSTHHPQKHRASSFYHDEVKRRLSVSGIKEGIQYRNDDDEKYNAIMTSMNPPIERTAQHIDNAKLELIRALAVSGGDVTSQPFLFALEQLRTLYIMTGFDARLGHKSKKYLEGNWLTISRPHFTECLGTNSTGEYMYTMGRMSFDMFTPGNLVCSIGGVFNSIQRVDSQRDKDSLKSIPKSLKDEVTKGDSILRRYK